MALLGFGGVISYESSTPGTYVEIAEIQSISGPSLARDSVETTHMKSPNHFRQFIPGLSDGGDLTFDISFEPTEVTHVDVTGLLSQLQELEVINYKLTWPDTALTEWIMPGFITGFEVDIPMDDKITASITIKVAGAPDFDA